GVCTNILLIYVICRFTRKEMGQYKQLLLVFASYGTLLIILHAYVDPVRSPTSSNWKCYITQQVQILTAVYCACLTVPFVLMNIDFLYRYWTPKTSQYSVLGILANALLLYAINRFTRKEFGKYKHLLFIFAAFDIFLTILHSVSEPSLTGFYCSCFSVPFVLINIDFLYRFWAVRHPHRIALFSNSGFALLLAFACFAEALIWFLLCIIGCTGKINDETVELLRSEYERKYGKIIGDGWLVMDHWVDIRLNLHISILLLTFDLIMIVSFTTALSLGTLTYRYINKARLISEQSRRLQMKLLIAVTAQTVVPLIFVYIPYFCSLNFPFFFIPARLMGEACMLLTVCFPAWDALIVIALMPDYRRGI
ncbi:hypothetical protein PFISCL1PPCAC_14036, partial [Pristionchus fissidentatus]